MPWPDALPNLFIGLREGLEAGAVSVAGSVAAVLSYSTGALSSKGQEAVGGLLSLLAVVLVTAMAFWMRRHSAGLSGHLRGQVQLAALIGGGALAVTAFLAVGREGLETTLFLGSAVKASGQTSRPAWSTNRSSTMSSRLGAVTSSCCPGCRTATTGMAVVF